MDENETQNAEPIAVGRAIMEKLGTLSEFKSLAILSAVLAAGDEAYCGKYGEPAGTMINHVHSAALAARGVEAKP